MNELEQLTGVFIQLGAPRPQAETMAAQLLKRAAQLAIERGISRETALAQLLKRVAEARSGETVQNVESPSSKTSAEK